MFKKYFIYFYLTFISFIAGALFIIQCGGQMNAIASALGIDYDNSSSNLSATTVQGAIDELVTTLTQMNDSIPSLPSVYESTGNKIGTYLGNINSVWEVWDTTREFVFTLDPGTGTLITNSDNEDIYFTTTDCTGTIYRHRNARGVSLPTNSYNSVIEINGILYKYVNGGVTASASDIKSAIEGDNWNGGSNACTSTSSASLLAKAIVDEELDDLDQVFIEATPIEEPIFTGPLYIE